MSIGPGTKLGQYEVQDFIGQGAMGLVYRAYHVQLERTGAVKVLQGIAPDPDTTARFRHEAQAIAQMRHPNILNVYDFGEFQGTPYMIVEYVPGGNLANRLSEGRLNQAAALKYLRGIAAGLDYAHGLGIVHRDVKPANVLLEKDDTPVIADFGLARLLQGSSLKSMTGVTTGTPAYMSPEQVTGSKVGPAADRYSLATIAYEMLTGLIPFDSEGLMELLYAQVHREPQPPSARNGSLNPQVDAVIMRGLAKDPAARWESSAAFVEALAAALATATEPATVRTLVVAPALASTMPLAVPVAAAAVAPFPRVGASDPVARQRSRKGRIAAVTAATLVALLIIGAAGFLATHQTPTLWLSASTVMAGDTVVVTAGRLPANQNGEIELRSTPKNFPFHSDANGTFSVPILIPRNIGAGDHVVSLCWSSACHASATVHVVEPVAVVTPSPATTPGTTSRPTSTPGPGPSASPSAGSTPVPTPRATPSPSPSPRPAPTPSPTIALVSISSTGTTTMVFHYFYAGLATITIHQGTTSKSVTRSVTPGSSTTVTFSTPPGFLVTAQPLVPQANVTVGSLVSNLVNVTL